MLLRPEDDPAVEVLDMDRGIAPQISCAPVAGCSRPVMSTEGRRHEAGRASTVEARPDAPGRTTDAQLMPAPSF
ncbi:MAG: hypothetical protein ABI251_02885, partial [Mycobacteriaceae bacterium]